MASANTSSAIALVIGCRRIREAAKSWLSAPMSWRACSVRCLARSSHTSSPSCSPMAKARCRTIPTRMASSAGSIFTTRPADKRVVTSGPNTSNSAGIDRTRRPTVGLAAPACPACAKTRSRWLACRRRTASRPRSAVQPPDTFADNLANRLRRASRNPVVNCSAVKNTALTLRFWRRASWNTPSNKCVLPTPVAP